MRMVGIELGELRCDHGHCAGSYGSKQRTSLDKDYLEANEKIKSSEGYFGMFTKVHLRSKPRVFLVLLKSGKCFFSG
jgi:hypothetical protein